MGRTSSKSLRLTFNLNIVQEKALWAFINDSLRSRRTSVLSSEGGSTSNDRKVVRVAFQSSMPTKIYLPETAKLPAQTITGHFIDLSMGGACIAVALDEFIPPHSQGQLALDFLSPPMKVGVTVMG